MCPASLALLLAAAPSGAQSLPADVKPEQLAACSRALEWTTELADGVGPRLSGSEGNRKATEWALRRLAALGFENVHAEPVKVPHWERGEEGGEIVAPTRQRLVLAALGGSPSTPPEGLEGEVVIAKDLGALQAMDPAQVRGRIVFISQKMEPGRTGEGYGAVVGARMAGPVVAQSKGAIAFLLRSITPVNARFAHTGMTGARPAAPIVPAAAISVPDAELLERLAAAGPVRVHLRLGGSTLPDADGANVIGEVRGSEKPDEIVVLGAHLDGWDLGPDAQDDAAGVGVVIDAARMLAALPKHPRRTIRVVLFACEEAGGIGGDAYARAHAAELPKHQAAFELDSGAGRAYDLQYQMGPGSDALFSSIAGELSAVGIAPARRGFVGHTDLIAIRKLGVPLWEFHQDATHYFDVHHSADDTIDKIDPAAMSQLAAVVAWAARRVADAPERLAPIPEGQRERAEKH